MQANPTIPGLGTVLGVWAHPDDEAFLSAGLMALARRHGQRVVVVTATAGEQGGDAGIRRQELAASLAAVGVTEHRWLGFVDGRCADVPLGLGRQAVAHVIDEVCPDTILTFGPDGLTGHPDHSAVSAWTAAAWQDAGRGGRLWQATFARRFHCRWGALLDELGVWMEGAQPPATPTSRLAMDCVCSGDLLDTKVAALRAHASQTSAMLATLGEAAFGELWAAESFVAAPASVSARAA